MPRSPEGVYTKPPGTNGGPPNTPISSTAYNNLMNDIAQDLNTPRPVVAGGTGGNNAIGGLDGLHTASVPIPASATTDLAGATGVSVLITGNSDIEEFGDVHAGAVRILTFEDDLTILYDDEDPKVILPAAASYQVTAGEVITLLSDGGGVWRILSSSTGAGSKTRFRVHKNGVNQNCTGTPIEIITFPTKEFDDGNHFDTATNRLTPPAGKHALSVSLVSRGNNGGPNDRVIRAELRKNGTIIAVGYGLARFFSEPANPTIFTEVEANGTDYFQVSASQASFGGAFVIVGESYETWFCGHAI